jgi:hypothetical protein
LVVEQHSDYGGGSVDVYTMEHTTFVTFQDLRLEIERK